ncbi:MAG: LytR family transcriptional regulator, partial [Gordonia sp. (in: high G+C Gram-positive bacteria)]
MNSDDSGSQPDRPEGPSRRSRRAGRTSQSYDFRARFGQNPGDEQAATPQQRAEGLREPVGRDQPVRGRGPVTVRHQMNHMGVEDQ